MLLLRRREATSNARSTRPMAVEMRHRPSRAGSVQPSRPGTPGRRVCDGHVPVAPAATRSGSLAMMRVVSVRRGCPRKPRLVRSRVASARSAASATQRLSSDRIPSSADIASLTHPSAGERRPRSSSALTESRSATRASAGSDSMRAPRSTSETWSIERSSRSANDACDQPSSRRRFRMQAPIANERSRSLMARATHAASFIATD